MTKTWLVAAAAIAVTIGGAQAQTSSSTTTSTQTTNPLPAPSTAATVDTTNQRTTDAYGNVIDKNRTTTTGTVVSPLGDTTTTKKTVDTITTH